MSQVTELASVQLTAVDSIAIELIKAKETPTVVIIRWPNKATVLHPRRFPAIAEAAARTFATAAVRPASIKTERKP
jgi:hypothetical protein